MSKGSVNKVILIGNLGADPEVRTTTGGSQVASLRIATSESWNDRQTGERTERTEWHRVTLYGKLAEIAGQYLRKGAKVYLEGRLQTRKWQDKDGNDRYTTEVIANEMQMLDSRPGGAGSGASPGDGDEWGASSSAKGPTPPPRRSVKDDWDAPAAAPSSRNDMEIDDDIPF
jgi:single-strand DNA-binding protein